MNIADIARRAKVSIATVSRTLNQSGPVKPATARKVWRAVTALNYYPNSHARALVSGRSRLIGLIVSDITNPFFPELIRSFEKMAEQRQVRSADHEHRLPDRADDDVPAADAGAQGGRRRDDDVGDGRRPDQGAVAARRADGVHGRRPGRAEDEPRGDGLRPRHSPGGRSPRRAGPHADRVHQRPARSALGADPPAGVRRADAQATG